MLKILLLIISLSALNSSKAQTKYFLNKKEIAPQSAFFLNPEDIDSIRPHVGFRTNTDTAITVYTNREDKILTFHQLLERFYIDESANSLPVNAMMYLDIEDPEKLVFSSDMVRGIFITRYHPGTKKSIHISSIYLHYDKLSEIESMLLRLIKKFNNIHPPKP